MTLGRPGPDCVELAFDRPYPVGAFGEVALEDYARALTRAEGAFALPAEDEPGSVLGLHLCAPKVPPRDAVFDDIEAFAREMAERSGDGLGWS